MAIRKKGWLESYGDGGKLIPKQSTNEVPTKNVMPPLEPINSDWLMQLQATPAPQYIEDRDKVNERARQMPVRDKIRSGINYVSQKLHDSSPAGDLAGTAWDFLSAPAQMAVNVSDPNQSTADRVTQALMLAAPVLKSAPEEIPNGLLEKPSFSKTGNVDIYNEDAQRIRTATDKFFTPEYNQPEAQRVKNDLIKRMDSPEGMNRMFDLNVDGEDVPLAKIIKDNKEFAYYDRDLRPIIGIHPDLPAGSVANITRHELEHVIQAGKANDLDNLLGTLELRKSPKPLPQDMLKRSAPILGHDVLDMLSNVQDATDYFTHGSEGKEKSAFLAELQQHMVDNKYVSHPYATNEITPDKIKEMYIDNKIDKNYPLRIFDIMKPTDNNFSILSQGLNRMLGITGATVATKNWLDNYKDK